MVNVNCWMETEAMELQLQLAGGPLQAATTQDVDVQVVDGLASVRPVIDHNPVAIGQTCVFGELPCRHHQVAQQLVDTEH